MTLRVFSYGGGVQSTAALVLAAQKQIDFSIFLFANVGDDSEHPDTLRYVREVAMPYAAQHDIELRELVKRRRDGSIETLYGRLMREGSKSLTIPVRLQNGAPARRQCTDEFKIRIVTKATKALGATTATPAVMGIGISLDEWGRMSTDDPKTPYIRKQYPLVDLRLTRQDCNNIISDAGLPLPPKSSCYFCPWHRIATWRRMRDHEPELFAKSVAIEAKLNTQSIALGQGPVFFTDRLVPLTQAVAGVQVDMFADEERESYSCGPFVCAALDAPNDTAARAALGAVQDEGGR